jgi:hypothetical protein
MLLHGRAAFRRLPRFQRDSRELGRRQDLQPLGGLSVGVDGRPRCVPGRETVVWILAVQWGGREHLAQGDA